MNKRQVHGPAVRAIREALGIKHGKFAIDCDISPAYLTNIEKGRKQPSAHVTASLLRGLGEVGSAAAGSRRGASSSKASERSCLVRSWLRS
jgi:DNA-binding transcriptional regulator YiaG